MPNQSIYDFQAKTIEGTIKNFSDYKGAVLLIVNTASKCGFTGQYEGLESLYRQLKDKNFFILGFPCNQFGHQEPGDENEIKKFCQLTYNVSFPLFAKIDVNGPGTHPVFQFLKNQKKGFLGTEKIKWNFTKFLIARDGQVLERYSPTVKPESIFKSIEIQLNSK